MWFIVKISLVKKKELSWYPQLLYYLKVPYKHQKISNKLCRNTDTKIFRQDKGRSRKDYIQKFVTILNTSQFRKLETDPTKFLERKV